MPKARNGEGSIKARRVTKGTVYDVQLTVRNRKTGLSERIFKGGFATERKAVEWRNEMMRKSAAGGLVREKPITVPEVVDAWMKAMPMKAPTTMISYDSIIKNHIRTRLNVRVSALTERTVREFCAGTKDVVRGDGNSTNSMAVNILRAALRWAVRPDVALIQANPLTDLGKGVVAPMRRRKPMPLPLVANLLAAAEGKPSHLLWRMLVETGARRGEITGLTWEDVDLVSGHLVIRRIASPESNGMRTSARTKGKVERIIPMPAALAAHLAELKTILCPSKTDPVIKPQRSSRHLGFSLIHGWWVRDCAAADISGYPPHSLRHTWATTALANGVPVNVVSSILGHASPAVTLEVYGHVMPSQKVAAIDLVSDLIQKQSRK